MWTRAGNVLLAISCIFAFTLLSCDEQKNRIMDNPFDANGSTWSPPTVKVLTKNVVVGMFDSFSLVAVGSDPSPEDKVVKARFQVPVFLSDSFDLHQDTVTGKLAFAVPGVYRVAVSVHDNHGVWSLGADTAIVDVHRYPPTAKMVALTDSVEPGDTIKLAMPWTDTSGKVVRYVWNLGDRIDTTSDSIKKYIAKSVGNFFVTGYAVDDDGNPSGQVSASAVVRTLNPWVVAIESNKDTVEELKNFTVTMHGADRAPGRVVKYAWELGTRIDTTSDSSHIFNAPQVGTFSVRGFVLDDKGYPSKDTSITLPVVRYVPKVDSINCLRDTGEVNKDLKFAMSGSDRNPGKIAKYGWIHDGRTDTTQENMFTVHPIATGTYSLQGFVIDDDNYSSPVREISVPITQYKPTAISLKPSRDTTEPNKGMKFTLRGTDRSPGVVAKWVFVHDGVSDTIKSSSSRVGTDTSLVLTPQKVGTYAVSGYVIDDEGYASNVVNASVAVKVYGPTATLLQAAKDTAEVGKGIVFRIRGKDQDTGKIVKWVLAHEGVIDTFPQDSGKVITKSQGKLIVWGMVIDNDGNGSDWIKDTIEVTAYPPTTTSLQSDRDTLELRKGMKFTLRGTDRSPGKIAKWVFVHDGISDTVIGDSTKIIAPTRTGSFSVAGYVIDDDGYVANFLTKTVWVRVWGPTTTLLQAEKDTAEVGKGVVFRVRGKDQDTGKIVNWVLAHEGITDTLKQDSGTIVPHYAGKCIVWGWVIDNDGNASDYLADTIMAAIYAPSVRSLHATSDTGEINKPIKFTLFGSDRSPGKVVKWVFIHDGISDTTTTDSSKFLTPTQSGKYAVGGFVIDDDGYASATIRDTIAVTSYNPSVLSLKAAIDTLEVNRPVRFTMKAMDRSPGKIASWVFVHDGVSDTVRADTTKNVTDTSVMLTPKTTGVYSVSGFVIDNDRNVSSTISVSYLVAVYRPSALLKGPDSAEINRLVKFTITGSDRAPGRVVSYVWSYAGITDTTTDSTRTFKQSSAGDMNVSAWAIDDEKNLSDRSDFVVKIKAHAPVLVPFGQDTVRISLGDSLYLTWKGTDAPTDPNGDSLQFRWTMSDGRTGWFLSGQKCVVVDTAAKVLRLDMKAYDKDSLASGVMSVVIKFMPKAPTILAPSSRQILADTTLFLQWRNGYLDSSFDVLVDTVPIASASQHAILRATTAKDSITLQVPFWNKIWYTKVVGRKGRDTSSSSEVRFASPENEVVRTTLSSLIVTDGSSVTYALDTIFTPDDTNYIVQIPSGRTQVTINALGSVTSQILEIGGVRKNGSSTSLVSVLVAPTIIPVKVISPNGKVFRNYRITVTRVTSPFVKLDGLSVDAAYNLSPSFNADTTTYTVAIPSGESTPITWTVNSLASVTVRHPDKSTAAVLRGTVDDTAGVILSVGRIGKDTNFYCLKVKLLPSRDARLGNLGWDTALSTTQSFDPLTQSYLYKVREGNSQAWIRPTLAEGQTMTIDGVTSLSGVVYQIPLKVGLNQSVIIVTAADGITTKTYTLGINRLASTTSTLFGLEPMRGTLDRTFSADAQTYRVVLPYAMDTAAVRANTTSPLAWGVRINGVKTLNNVWTPVTKVAAGDSMVYKLEVLAEDTTSRRTYELRVVRTAPDTSRYLTSLALSSTKNFGTIDNPFDGPADDSLGMVTSASDTNFALTAVWTSTAIRSVKVGSTALASGVSQSLAINRDDTLLPVVVMAQDASKSRTYWVRIHFAPTATMSVPDSGEINHQVAFKLSGTDRAPGTIVKYVWARGTTRDTTATDTHFFVQAASGDMTVSGWTLDNDGHLSAVATKTVSIKAHAPVLNAFGRDTIWVALRDTARFPWRGTDAPTDPRGDSLILHWTTDDGRSGVFGSFDTGKISDTAAKVVRVEVWAQDRDSLFSGKGVVFVKFMPRAPTITNPVSSQLLQDTSFTVRWVKGLIDSSFEVFADTLTDPVKSYGSTVKDTFNLQLPQWNRTWYLKVVGHRSGGVAASTIVKFQTAEKPASRTILSAFSVSEYAGRGTTYTVSPVFNPLDTNYSVEIEGDITQIYLHCKGALADQVIEVNGAQGSGTYDPLVNVTVAPVNFAIKVYSPDAKSWRTYHLKVTRKTSPYVKLDGITVGGTTNLFPAFQSDTTSYTVAIPKGETVPLSWAVNSVAAVRVQHGTNYYDQVAELRGNSEDSTGVYLIVTRPGQNTNYYRIAVKVTPSRDARLSVLNWANAENLSVDSSSFVRNVSEGVASTWFRPTLQAGQTMTINGTPATSAADQVVNLIPGMNTSTIKVTAPDGVTTRTYSLLFYRQPSTDNYLSNLQPVQGTITFDPAYQSYRLVLPFPQDSAAMKAKVRGANAWGMRVGGVKLTDDTWTPVRRLAPGDSVVYDIEVLAEDTTFKRPYKLTILRTMPDTTHYLNELALSVSKGSLTVTDGFADGSDTMVVGNVAYDDSILGIRATWTNPSYRSVMVGADTLQSFVYKNFTMKTPKDTNLFPIKVVAQDSSKTRTYWVKIFRGPPSRNADLGTLTAKFSGTGTQPLSMTDSVFTLAVPFRDSLLWVQPTTADVDAFRVGFHGKATPNGTWSDSVGLLKNDTTRIVVQVVAQDTSRKKSYILKVYRASESQNANLSYLDMYSRLTHQYQYSVAPTDSVYRFTVPWHDSLFTIKPSTADAFVRQVVVGGKVTALDKWSDSVALTKVADTNRIAIQVMAQDSTVTRTYTVNVYRESAHTDANLANLTLASLAGTLSFTPVFDTGTRSYTASTLFLDSTVKVTPTWRDPVARSIAVKGDTVVSGTASRSIHLAAGDTTVIPVVVTAQNSSTTRTYQVKVFRNQRSTNALLAAFGADVGNLSPQVNSIDNIYSLSVVSSVASVGLVPSTIEPHASFTVNGYPATRTIALDVAGTTTNVTIVVTAQDTSVKRTYTLQILRERDASTLAGQITKDTTLGVANSPYLVTAALVVNKGIKLTIEPGVRLKFKPGIGMTVKGTLIAKGDASNKIVFTRAESGNWGMILFDSTATAPSYDGSGNYVSGSVIANSVIEYGGSSAATNAAALFLRGKAPYLESSTIQYSSSNGINGDSLGTQFWNTLTVRNNAGNGVLLTASGDVTWNGGQVNNNIGNGFNLTLHTFHLRQATVSGNGRGMYVTPTTTSATLVDWLVVDTCQFLNNTVSGHGGGVYVASGYDKDNLESIFRGNLFQGNVATDRAGGLYYEPADLSDGQRMLMVGNSFKNNQAGTGGAVFLRWYYAGDVSFNLLGNQFVGNFATNAGAVAASTDYGWSGGSYYDSANTYSNNRSGGANGYAGAVWLNGSNAGAGAAKSIRVVSSRFEGNSALVSGSGALEIPNASSCDIVGNVFLNNYGVREGAARFTAATNLSGNLFQGNSTPGTVGALYWGGNITGSITNNTFSGNAAATGGSAISTIMEIDGFPTMAGNNFLANTTDRLLRTDNVFGEADINAQGNWWNSASPTFYSILVDGYSDLPTASSMGNFDVSALLSAPNALAPAIQ